ncbi:hypothetical protein [Azorhizobium doebereinerae]|uniref:hypothetical protein n=1 Tax=Azorhizobium doebereinerae TaxID=281091 RepID=UPI000402DCD6|nr:hypothetical protein [Azorhizobium doebereinerae]
MRTISYAALALTAGLALSGAAQADEYVSAANREQYAVSAQGFLPNTATEQLLPTAAQATARVHATAAQQQAPATNSQDEIVGPFSDKDPHSGPAHSGIPSRL